MNQAQMLPPVTSSSWQWDNWRPCRRKRTQSQKAEWDKDEEVEGPGENVGIATFHHICVKSKTVKDELFTSIHAGNQFKVGSHTCRTHKKPLTDSGHLLTCISSGCQTGSASASWTSCRSQITDQRSCSTSVVCTTVQPGLISDQARNCTAYIPPVSPLLLSCPHIKLSTPTFVSVHVVLQDFRPADVNVDLRAKAPGAISNSVCGLRREERGERRPPGNKKGNFQRKIHLLPEYFHPGGSLCRQRSRVREAFKMIPTHLQQHRLIIPFSSPSVRLGHRTQYKQNSDALVLKGGVSEQESGWMRFETQGQCGKTQRFPQGLFLEEEIFKSDAVTHLCCAEEEIWMRVTSSPVKKI